MTEAGMASRYSLDGRVAIVTGGAGLLGASHCQALAQSGASVVVADIDGEQAQHVAEQVNREPKGTALAIAADVRDPDSVRAMVSLTLERFDRIDVLVNNAALDPKFDEGSAGEHLTRFEEFPLSAWNESLSVNLTGMFLCAQSVTAHMVEQGRGSIINVSSTYGLVGPDQRLYQVEGQSPEYKPVTYSVTKAAVLGLTRYLATYFAGTGIRVNTLTPGGVYAGHAEDFVERYSAKTVLGRMADREEISAALLFLASEASSYMTGANLVVDGGWTAW